MDAHNAFYALLYDVMLAMMPGVKLSTTGAYMWRGFRIDSYKNLAANQYYCQISHERPHTLEFKESFKYRGKYQHPYRKPLDLCEANFFEKNLPEQRKSLEDFISGAVSESLLWQDSPERKEQVPLELQAGKKIFRHKYTDHYPIQQVSKDFTLALPMQHHFFQMLRDAITIAGREVLIFGIDLKVNANWCNWGFRGYRQKTLLPDGKLPPGPSQYFWRIDFKNPALLICEKNKGVERPVIPAFQITPSFLSASEPEQKDQLYQYALRCLQLQTRP